MDYHALNKLTIKDSYPLPRHKDLLDQRGSAKYFMSIDLHSGYWQCCIADKDIPKTTFLMRYGLYKWVVMPMGLTNAPATFMHTMNSLFLDMLDSDVAVFLNNSLMYSGSVDKYFSLLEQVLALLHQYTFYCKLKKCSFLCNSTTLLGFDVTPEGMCISDLKVQSLSEWPIPTTLKLVQSFLGFV